MMSFIKSIQNILIEGADGLYSNDFLWAMNASCPYEIEPN